MPPKNLCLWDVHDDTPLSSLSPLKEAHMLKGNAGRVFEQTVLYVDGVL